MNEGVIYMENLLKVKNDIDNLKQKINDMVLTQRNNGKASDELIALSKQLDFLIVEYIKLGGGYC